MCSKRSGLPLPACTSRGMQNCGGGADFKKRRGSIATNNRDMGHAQTRA